jgi:hypothetical protein
MRGLGWTAVAAIFVLAACEQGQDPTAFGDGFTPAFVTTSPITPTPGQGDVYVCKDGTEAAGVTYSNNVNVTIQGGVSNPFTVNPDAAGCVFVSRSTADNTSTITFTETDDGANSTFDHVDVFQFVGGSAGTLVFTSTTSSVVDLGAGTSRLMNNDTRYVVVYTNTPDEPPPDGCTHTIGYWKTHAGFTGNNPDVVTQYLPIDLGDAGGTETVVISTAAEAVAALSFYGEASNGINKLYGQLLGAKLSIADGADDTAIAGVIAAADAFLANNNAGDWDSLTKAEQQIVLGWVEQLDSYNNGLIGPGHCDEEEVSG